MFFDLPFDILDRVCQICAQEEPGAALVSLQLTSRTFRALARRHHLHAVALKSPQQVEGFTEYISNLCGPSDTLPRDVLPVHHLLLVGKEDLNSFMQSPCISNPNHVHQILSITSLSLRSLALHKIQFNSNYLWPLGSYYFPELRELAVTLCDSELGLDSRKPRIINPWPELSRLYSSINSVDSCMAPILQELHQQHLVGARLILGFLSGPYLRSWITTSKWKDIILQLDGTMVQDYTGLSLMDDNRTLTLLPMRYGNPASSSCIFSEAWVDGLAGGEGFWDAEWFP